MKTRFGVISTGVNGQVFSPQQKVNAAKNLGLTLVRTSLSTKEPTAGNKTIQAYKDAKFEIQLNLNYEGKVIREDHPQYLKNYPLITKQFCSNIEDCLSPVYPNLLFACVENEPLNKNYFETNNDEAYYRELLAVESICYSKFVECTDGGLPAGLIHLSIFQPKGRKNNPQITRVENLLNFIKHTPSPFVNFHFNDINLSMATDALNQVCAHIIAMIGKLPICNEFHFTKLDPVTIERTVKKICECRLTYAIVFNGQTSQGNALALTDIEGNLNNGGRLFVEMMHKYNA